MILKFLTLKYAFPAADNLKMYLQNVNLNRYNLKTMFKKNDYFLYCTFIVEHLFLVKLPLVTLLFFHRYLSLFNAQSTSIKKIIGRISFKKVYINITTSHGNRCIFT